MVLRTRYLPSHFGAAGLPVSRTNKDLPSSSAHDSSADWGAGPERAEGLIHAAEPTWDRRALPSTPGSPSLKTPRPPAAPALRQMSPSPSHSPQTEDSPLLVSAL